MVNTRLAPDSLAREESVRPGSFRTRKHTAIVAESLYTLTGGNLPVLSDPDDPGDDSISTFC